MSQIIQFRLQNGDIYGFEYSKYSDFIDNLEPEPGVIIDVLEPFTLEDFETAHLKYKKYLVYREYLEYYRENIEYIKTHPNYEYLDELIKLSKYDLNNPVLEWLMIRETREDKDIKEAIYDYLQNKKCCLIM